MECLLVATIMSSRDLLMMIILAIWSFLGVLTSKRIGIEKL